MVPPNSAPGDARLGPTLLALARNAIARELGQPEQPEPRPPERPARLAQPGATFVTLTRQGQLRGCIGSLEAYRPLAEDVAANARAAAFRDPRFDPVDATEYPDIALEVSLLSAPEPFPVRDEGDALARLRPGEDGLVFTFQGRRATFLPQVWESLPDPEAFLTQLKRKAGLPGDFWDPAVHLERYRVQHWQESQS